MYCPKCGDELIDERGELTCKRGNMGLSQDLAQRLSECFISRSRAPREDNVLKTEHKWFCPGCGVVMQRDEKGLARCPECERTINAFIYVLTEIHPHAKVED